MFRLIQLIEEFPFVDDNSQNRERKKNIKETPSKLVKLEPKDSVCEMETVSHGWYYSWKGLHGWYYSYRSHGWYYSWKCLRERVFFSLNNF